MSDELTPIRDSAVALAGNAVKDFSFDRDPAGSEFRVQGSLRDTASGVVVVVMASRSAAKTPSPVAPGQTMKTLHGIFRQT